MWPFDYLKSKPAAKTIDYRDSFRGGAGWQTLYGPLGQWIDSSELFTNLTHAQMEAAYKSHPIVHACVNQIMTSAAEPRIEVGMQMGDEWEPLASHWALDLFDWPNEHYSGNDLVQYIAGRLALTGIAYVWKFRNKAGSRIAELWPLPTSWVTPVYAKSGNALVLGYRIFGNDGLIPPEDIIEFRLPDLGSTVGGVGGMDACARDYQLDLERENYLAEMLVNLKVPGMVVKVKELLTPEKRAAIQAFLNDEVGRGNRGNPLLLEGDGDTKVENPLGDMDWPGFTSLTETRIHMAFGVPPILTGSRAGLDRSTYSNYEQARVSFYRETMIPKWNQMGGGFSIGLLRKEGEMRLRVKFAYDELPEMQEDENARSARVTSHYSVGIITRDAAGARLGYKPEELEEDPEPMQFPETPAEAESEGDDALPDDENRV